MPAIRLRTNSGLHYGRATSHINDCGRRRRVLADGAVRQGSRARTLLRGTPRNGFEGREDQRAGEGLMLGAASASATFQAGLEDTSNALGSRAITKAWPVPGREWALK